MINATRKDDQIVFLELNPDPLIASIAHIEKSLTIPDVSNLFILMQVLVKEHLDFIFVHIAHLLWRDGDHVPVLVAALDRELVNLAFIGNSIIEDTDLLELIHRHIAATVVRLTLVTLRIQLAS